MNQKTSSGLPSERKAFFIERGTARYGPFYSHAEAMLAGFHVEPPIIAEASRIFCLAADDLKARDQIGWNNHGIALENRPNVDWLREAYEEALDLCVYLRGALYKRDGK